MMVINDINYIDDKCVEGELSNVVGGYCECCYNVIDVNVDQNIDQNVDQDVDVDIVQNFDVDIDPDFEIDLDLVIVSDIDIQLDSDLWYVSFG